MHQHRAVPVHHIAPPPPPPAKKAPPRRPVYIIKDVRLFLNSVSRGMETIRRAGVDARCEQQEDEESITITIQIPKKQAKTRELL